MVQVIADEWIATHGVEYTEEFMVIDQMVNDHDADAAAPQRQGAVPFQWGTVMDACTRIAVQCPDLRVGIWMLRAAMATQSLSGVGIALQRLVAWCALPIGQLFPQGEDGDDARELHALTLSWLGSPVAVFALGNTALHSNWPLTLTALVNSQEPLAADDATKAQVLADASAALAAMEVIEALLMQHNAAQTLSLASALNLLRLVKKRLTPEADSHCLTAHTAPAQHSALGQAGAQGSVMSRSDAQRALTQIIEYFKTHEPGHPAPLFLTRVQRMLGASFEDLMRELYHDAPQLVAKLEKPAGH